MLGDLADFARDAVTSAGLIGIFLLMIAEVVFPPIPSEIVLPLAGFEVARGNLGFIPVLLAATLGSLTGSFVLYLAGRVGGRPIILRWGKILRVGAEELDRSERWFERWGDWFVLVSRVIPLVRSIASIPAGICRMNVARFILLTGVGTLIWNIVLIGAGYQLGANWEDVSRVVGRYADVMVLVTGLFLVAGVVWLWRRRSARAPQ